VCVDVAIAVPNARRCSGRSWKTAPITAARIADPLPAERTPVRENPSIVRKQDRIVAMPMPQGSRQNHPTKDRRNARAQRSGSGRKLREALRDQRRLFRVVGDVAGSAEETVAVELAEAAGDALGGHAFAGEAEGVAQGGAQERAGDAVAEIHVDPTIARYNEFAIFGGNDGSVIARLGCGDRRVRQ